MSTSPVQLRNGSYGMIYQNPDGSMRIEEIKDSAQIMNDDATKFVTELIKSGKITDISQVPASVRANLPDWAMTGLVQSPSGYYGGFRVTQNAGDKSPNAKDN